MMSDIVLSSERPVDSKFSEKSEVMPILARRSYCGVWSLAAPTCQEFRLALSAPQQIHSRLLGSRTSVSFQANFHYDLAHIALLTGITLTSFTQSQAILPPPSIQQP